MINPTAPRQQRLPTELILTIFEHAEANQFAKLSTINKALRSLLLSRLFQAAHLHSFAEVERLIIQGWPNITLPNGDLINPNTNTKLALYLQFLYFSEYSESHYERLIDCLQHLSKSIRNKVDTLGFSTLQDSSLGEEVILGLWMLNFFPNLKRLYVDATSLPHIEEGKEGLQDQPMEAVLGHLHYESLPLEAYALAGVANGNTDGVFSQRKGLLALKGQYKTIFPSLQRLNLFDVKSELPSEPPGEDSQDELMKLAMAFTLETEVKVFAIIEVSKGMGKDWCAPPADVLFLPMGLMVFVNICVEEPKAGHDLIALIHRVIDDIDSEWAPRSFNGRRWHPSTSPIYITGVPDRAAFQKKGYKISERMASTIDYPLVHPFRRPTRDNLYLQTPGASEKMKSR